MDRRDRRTRLGNAEHDCAALTLPTTKVLAGRRRHREDGRVVEALAGLPAAEHASHGCMRAGIANEDGQVYRVVLVFSTFQLLHLTARLNAMGFSVSPELIQSRRSQYERIFAKKGSARSTTD